MDGGVPNGNRQTGNTRTNFSDCSLRVCRIGLDDARDSNRTNARNDFLAPSDASPYLIPPTVLRTYQMH